MDKDTLLKELRNLSGWKEMLMHEKASVCFEYKGVTFLLFRNDATYFLKYQPKDSTQVRIVMEFNTLMEECSEDIRKEMEEWDHLRLMKDDNER